MHDRVLILTDEQYAASRHGDPTDQAPAGAPVRTWNLPGHRPGHGPSGKANRHTREGAGRTLVRVRTDI
ncbi:hypothetical protein [Streptomyces griseoruber]|uniref:Uncharacterized protein n=1 Tax=Streptomyces griseoruber TaxID=1943 RepID=A0A101T7Y6_9ACTN|nr:hypothetical protein [Streptomyces griseoruber]KUN87513.1 hypothetical protein AQJ64_05010 [Streptomyces griseoruber]